MRQPSHALRVGICAVLCAAVFRLCAGGLPDRLAQWLGSPEAAAYILSVETGRNVRFSPSLEAFSPDFMESPAPSLPEPTIPAFSGEEDVALYYACDKEPDISSLLARPLNWDLQGDAPTVLLYSTHSTESYTKTTESYRESAAWRTRDEHYNMLAIGSLVARQLEAAGIRVLRDTAVHDYPSYNGSYASSRKSVKAALEENPGILLVLDLHRDASAEGSSQMRTCAMVDGEPSAQLMLVVGTNHENYEENLSLALKLHVQLERQSPGITRPLQLRSQRFNQDLHPNALIVEVGAAGNTHPEAARAAQQLAEAIIALAQGSREAQEGK